MQHDDEVAVVIEAFEPTGDETVDVAMRELSEGVRDDADGDARVAAFEAAHRALQDRLADVEG